MSRNPILVLWKVIGRIRLNPWIGYVTLTWLLVVVPVARLVRDGVSQGRLLDLGLIALVAMVFTLGSVREARREEAELDLLTSGATVGNAAVLPPKEIDALLEQGTTTEALGAVEAAIGTAPQDPTLWCMWARCQMTNEEPRLARRAIDRALTIDPNHSEALYLQAWSKRIHWDFAGARATADIGLATAPSHSGLRFEQRESTRMIEQWTRKKALPKQHRGAPIPTPKPPRQTVSARVPNGLSSGVAAPLELAQAAESVETTAPVEIIDSVETENTELAEVATDSETLNNAFSIEETVAQEASVAFPAGDIHLHEFIVEPEEHIDEGEAAQPPQHPWGDFDLAGLLDDLERSSDQRATEPVPVAPDPETEVEQVAPPVTAAAIPSIPAVTETTPSAPIPEPVLSVPVPPEPVATVPTPVAPAPESPAPMTPEAVQAPSTQVAPEPVVDVTEPLSQPEPVDVSSPFANLQKFAAKADATLSRVAANQAEHAA